MAKLQKPSWSRYSVRFTEKQMLPYVIAIGQLTLAWNDLHEKLGMLFCVAMGGGWAHRWAALWNAASFDRPKRKLLEAAITTMTPAATSPYPRLQSDVRVDAKAR